MRTRHLVTLAASVLALAAPTMSQASAPYHYIGPGDASYAYFPDHDQSNKTSAEVRAELAAAQEKGNSAALQGNRPVVNAPIASTGLGMTRAEVLNDLYSETQQERRARAQIYSGG